MKDEKIKREAKLTVTRHFRVQGKDLARPETEEQLMEIRTFQAPHATVSVEYGLTLNLGNYETARVMVGVQVPCYPEEIDEAQKVASDWVEKKVREQVESIRSPSSKMF